MTVFENMDGSRMAVQIKESNLTSSPIWEPGQGVTPFSVDQANRAVKTWVKGGGADHAELNVDELVLKRIRSGRDELHWRYLVRYRVSLAGGVKAEKESVTAVFFNGDVAPVIELPSL